MRGEKKKQGRGVEAYSIMAGVEACYIIMVGVYRGAYNSMVKIVGVWGGRVFWGGKNFHFGIDFFLTWVYNGGIILKRKEVYGYNII